nr:reverse transcriptase domain-containing protein [Tanacetum cinerariifolium]
MKTTLRVTTISIHNVFAIGLKMKVTTVRVLSVVGLKPREEKETPADFLVEIPFKDNERKEKPKEVPNSSSKWRLYIYGSFNSDRSGARNQNKKAYTLSKLASMTFEHLTKEVLVEVLIKRSIEEKEVLEGRDAGEEKLDGPYL